MKVFGNILGTTGKLVLGATTLLFPLLQAHAQTPTPYLLPYTINTIIGQGVAPSLTQVPCPKTFDTFGDGCLASQAFTTGDIHDTNIDGQGNIFFIDNSSGSVIRRIDARTGIVSAIAGTFTTTSKICKAPPTGTAYDKWGDGCPANDGLSNSTTGTTVLAKGRGMSVTKSGDVFFAGFGSNLIQRFSYLRNTSDDVFGLLSGSGTAALGAASYAGDGGPATQALLAGPRGVGSDNFGNFYVADTTNNVVRMVYAGGATAASIISLTNGGITPTVGFAYTIAGVNPKTGLPAVKGEAGDGTLATSATVLLSSPEDIDVDALGNIFIADAGGNKVRVIYAAGTQVAKLIALENSGAVAQRGFIYSIAGGGVTSLSTTPTLATSTAIGNDRKIAVDALGNIWIADNTSFTIDFLDGQTGYIRIIAGIKGATGNATCTGQTDNVGDGCPATQAILNPISNMGVGVDALGNIYIGDSGNFRLRKVSTNQFFPAIPYGSSVTQTLTVHMAALDVANVAGFTISGSPSFTISTAPVCTLNPDTTQDCILSITYTPRTPGQENAALVVNGALTGNTNIELSGSGIAATIAVDPGVTASLATGLNNAQGVAVDNAGNTYIAETGKHRVIRISGGVITVIAGTGLPGNSGNGGLATAALLNAPKAVTVTPDGAIYIADTGNNVLRRVDAASGIITLVAGAGSGTCATATDAFGDGCSGTQAILSAPAGLTSDSTGNVFISDTGNNLIRELAVGGNIALVAGGTNACSGGDSLGNGCNGSQAIFSGPTGLAIDTALNIYVADTGNSEVRKITALTGLVSAIAGTGANGSFGNNGVATSAQLSTPTGVAVDAAGNIYIADTGNSVIRLAPVSGNISTVAGIFVTPGTGTLPGSAALIQLNNPSAVASTGAGFLTILDTGNSRAFTDTRTSVVYNFGRTNDGSTSPALAIQETSTGSATATFTTPLYTATGATTLFALTPSGSTGCTGGQSLAPGASCTLSATFSPIAIGPSSATYTEGATNTINNQAPVIQLSGTGAIQTKTTTTLAVTSPGTPQYGLPFTITALATPASCDPTAPTCFPNGTISLFISAGGAPAQQYKGPVQVDATGHASFTVTGLSVGPYTLTAVYNGDPFYASSTSAGLPVVVAQGTTTSTVVATPATLLQFAFLSLTAHVVSPSGQIPTGQVSFFANGVLITTPPPPACIRGITGTASLSAATGFATLQDFTRDCNTPPNAIPPISMGLFAGTYAITCTYAGDANFAPSTCAPFSLVVQPDPSDFSMTVLSPSKTTAVGTAQGSTGQADITITPTNTLNGSISFACSGLPANTTCTFSPTFLAFTPVPGAAAPQLAQVTIFTDVLPGFNPFANATPVRLFGGSQTALATLLGWPVLLFSVVGIFGFRKRIKATRLLSIAAFLGMLVGSSMVLSGCGSSIRGPVTTPVGTYTVTVTATSTTGTIHSQNLTFTVGQGVPGQL